MSYPKQIDRLAEILEAEAAGKPVNTRQARELAAQLIALRPDIAGSMMRVVDRFGRDHAA